MIWIVEFVSPLHTTSLSRVYPYTCARPTTPGADTRKSLCCWSSIFKKRSSQTARPLKSICLFPQAAEQPWKWTGRKYCPTAPSAVTGEGLLMIWQVLQELIDLMQVSSPDTRISWWRSLKEFGSKRNQPEQLFNLKEGKTKRVNIESTLWNALDYFRNMKE